MPAATRAPSCCTRVTYVAPCIAVWTQPPPQRHGLLRVTGAVIAGAVLDIFSLWSPKGIKRPADFMLSYRPRTPPPTPCGQKVAAHSFQHPCEPPATGLHTTIPSSPLKTAATTCQPWPTCRRARPCSCCPPPWPRSCPPNRCRGRYRPTDTPAGCQTCPTGNG